MKEDKEIRDITGFFSKQNKIMEIIIDSSPDFGGSDTGMDLLAFVIANYVYSKSAIIQTLTEEPDELKIQAMILTKLFLKANDYLDAMIAMDPSVSVKRGNGPC